MNYRTAEPGRGPSQTSKNQTTELAGVSVISSISHIQVPLTAANLIAMYATPFNIVPAVAANVLVFYGALYNFVYGSAAFTGGGDILLQLGTTNHGGGTQVGATLDASATLTKGTANGSLYIPPAALVCAINTGIYISNKTGVLVTGTGCTATLDIWYGTIPQS